MGYSHEGSIKKYSPDDTVDCFYIEGSSDLDVLIERALEKWPGIAIDEVLITSEYIHTDCLTYDQYDAADHTKYLCISAHKAYFDRIAA